MSLFLNMQEFICEVLSTVESLTKPKFEGLIKLKVENSLQDFLLGLSPAQVSPKVGKDFMG